jgi:hypothetical protein
VHDWKSLNADARLLEQAKAIGYSAAKKEELRKRIADMWEAYRRETKVTPPPAPCCVLRFCPLDHVFVLTCAAL